MNLPFIIVRLSPLLLDYSSVVFATVSLLYHLLATSPYQTRLGDTFLLYGYHNTWNMVVIKHLLRMSERTLLGDCISAAAHLFSSWLLQESCADFLSRFPSATNSRHVYI